MPFAVVLVGIFSFAGFFHYLDLSNAAGAIHNPATARVTDASVLAKGGRSGGVSATAYFTDSAGQPVAAKLPDLGDRASAFKTPFTVVYDRQHPGRAMLLSDWRTSHARGTHAAVYVWGSIAAADAVVVVGFVLWVVGSLATTRRLRRSRGG